MKKRAYYHLPGLFEFYELYRVFLPLFGNIENISMTGARLVQYTGLRQTVSGLSNYKSCLLYTSTKRQQDMDRVFTEMTEKLSCALVGFVNSLNPQKIIIGHEGYWIPDPRCV